MRLYNWVLIAWVILSILISFNIVNQYQPIVKKIWIALERLTEPVLSRIRRYLPDLGPIDLSPIVLIVLLNFLESVLYNYFYKI
ncbi:MAG: YggT family protein [Burkholderiales bacterium]